MPYKINPLSNKKCNWWWTGEFFVRDCHKQRMRKQHRLQKSFTLGLERPFLAHALLGTACWILLIHTCSWELPKCLHKQQQDTHGSIFVHLPSPALNGYLTPVGVYGAGWRTKWSPGLPLSSPSSILPTPLVSLSDITGWAGIAWKSNKDERMWRRNHGYHGWLKGWEKIPFLSENLRHGIVEAAM